MSAETSHKKSVPDILLKSHTNWLSICHQKHLTNRIWSCQAGSFIVLAQSCGWT